MKLNQLVRNLPLQIKGSKTLDIHGLSTNSQRVIPGSLFIAKNGLKTRGRDHIKEAVRSGAVAVLTDLYNPFLPVCQLIAQDPGKLEAQIAVNYYQFPSKNLHCIGVTGTNGKTTTTFILQHLIKRLIGPCGLIGTIHYDTGQRIYDAELTTPEAAQMQKLLREMVQSGCKSVVMEVSSHALSQDRVEGISFDGAVFTNLSWDHLDYHHTLSDYALAKKRLFQQLDKSLKPHRFAVINADDERSLSMIENCRYPSITFSTSATGDITASEINHSLDGTEFKITWRSEIVLAQSPLLGTHNIYNALAATACLLARGIALEKIAHHLVTLSQIPGRLQRVSNFKNLSIFVDFAHTEDALAKALTALRLTNPGGRLIVVFGCGGNRDVQKRPKMGKIASTLSDFAFLTSDNSRDEDPYQICHAIQSGLESGFSHKIEIDRKKAIQKAIDFMSLSDILLIAGKGHEKNQIARGISTPFDDVEEVQCACLLKKN